jgi:predicted glycosyltransferase
LCATILISVGGGVCGRRLENANHAARQREDVKRKCKGKCQLKVVELKTQMPRQHRQ